MEEIKRPRVEIKYCTGCRWLLRSAWIAQELLTTFEKEIGEVALVPAHDEAGVFQIRVDGSLVFDRKEEGKFPELAELKQVLRDLIAPSKSLGHSDKKTVAK